MTDSEMALNEELQRRGYFLVRHCEHQPIGHVFNGDVVPLIGQKVAVVGLGTPDDIEEFDTVHRRSFPDLSKGAREHLLTSFPYIYRCKVE